MVLSKQGQSRWRIVLFFFLGTVACAAPIPLEERPCPCLESQGYRCCQTEGICYRSTEMPAACLAGTGGAVGTPVPEPRGGSDSGSTLLPGDVSAAETSDASPGGRLDSTNDAPLGALDGLTYDAPLEGTTGSPSDARRGEIDAAVFDAASGVDAGSTWEAPLPGTDSRVDGAHALGDGSLEGPLSPADDRAAVDGFFSTPVPLLAAGTWRYSTADPPTNWTEANFNPTQWQVGGPGFGFGTPMPGDRRTTVWLPGVSEMWFQTTFTIDAKDIPNVLFWTRWDDSIEIYLNGILAASEPYASMGYRYLGLTKAARASLKSQTSNTIAVHVRDAGGGRFFDLAVATNAAFVSMPTFGEERTPALAAYTQAVRQFMLEHGIPGGVLAVMKKGQVVVKRGIGWKDKHFTKPMLADAVMRMGSIDTLITRGAIHRLIDEKAVDPITRETISLNTPVFPLFRAHGLAPLPGRTPDSSVDQITVRMLLEESSGIRDLPWVPELYTALGLPPGTPISMEDEVRWIYSNPLLFPPGSAVSSTSSEFMLLRYLVHKVKGDFLTYLRTNVMQPAGSSDVFIAHERLVDREPREPGYLTLEIPYDRWPYLEGFTALASTAEALVRYLRRYHAYLAIPLIDSKTGQWGPPPDATGGVYYGSMPGTWALIEQNLLDEVSFAVMFNLSGYYDALTLQLESITKGLSSTDWGL